LNAVPKNPIPTVMIPPTLNSNEHSSPTSDSFCRHIMTFHDEVTFESRKVDDLLIRLQQYYQDVKTRRQLDLEVSTGFCQQSEHQRNLLKFRKVTEASSSVSNIADHDIPLLSTLEDSSPPILSDTPVANSSSQIPVPILWCVDKPSTSLPSRKTYREDFVRASVGFWHFDSIKANFSTLYQDTISFDTLPSDAVLDHGDFATLRKSARNTTLIPRPQCFGDVVHMDIVIRPDVSLGNIHYGLLFTDRYSCMTYLYPLQNLTSDIIKQLESFFAHLAFHPKRLISDFDNKLIGGKLREYLNHLRIHVNAAPANRQDHNGLAE